MNLIEALNFYPQFSQEQIAVLAEKPIHVVRKALRNNGHELSDKLTKAWREEIQHYFMEHTVPELADMYVTTQQFITIALYREPPKNVQRQCVDEQAVINFMLADKGKTKQEDIGKRYGISQSRVSQLNPYRRRGVSCPRKTEGEWYEILKYADANTVSAAARLYGVSRTAIIKRQARKRRP
ncbi:MAG: hypothetical protein ACRCSS_05035 [Shewanella sp.]